VWILHGVIAFADTIMKPLTSNQSRRRERKKKKLSAYLEIAKLNDSDREVSESLPPLTMMCGCPDIFIKL
jgi:hypothetical protein